MYAITAQSNTTYQDEQDVSLSALNVNGLLGDLQQKIGLPPKKQDTRKELLNELYKIYATEQDNKNRINYYRYIRVHHPAALSKEEDYYKYKDEYRTAKLPENIKYSPLIKKGDYLWWNKFTHLQGENGNRSLQHMLSVVKDMLHRKQYVVPYILGATKVKPEDLSTPSSS